MKSLNNKAKTIFCDIDGTILNHAGKIDDLIYQLRKPEYQLGAKLLEGVKERFQEWEERGYNIILTTGRRESLREVTEKQLLRLGISYDQLIMGIGGGQRVLINDLKPNSTEPTAIAICLKRDGGMKNVKI